MWLVAIVLDGTELELQFTSIRNIEVTCQVIREN